MVGRQNCRPCEKGFLRREARLFEIDLMIRLVERCRLTTPEIAAFHGHLSLWQKRSRHCRLPGLPGVRMDD